LTTVLSKIADALEDIKTQNISDNERDELKKALIDRIGCGLGAISLGIGKELFSLIQKDPSHGSSIIWGTNLKTEPSSAALINGAISSHLEYDAHDSMIPAAIALGEDKGVDGEKILQSLKTGYFSGIIMRRLLASEVEKRGLHWPAYLGAFSAAAACSNILELPISETRAAIGIAATLCPVSPFEAFTKGASVKDLYGGWGNMLGVKAANLAEFGLTGPDTVFEGKRGLFMNWLGKIPSEREIETAFNLDDVDVMFHVKPYPCCTAAIPTLTAIEKLLRKYHKINTGEISKISIDTYHFGLSLSEESDPSTPIGAKVNIPFLAASMLVHSRLLPEHTEIPWINSENIKHLSSLISVTCSSTEKELQSRQRYAHVVLEMKNGESLEAYSDAPKWSKVPASQSEIIEKFMENVGDLLPNSGKELIISTIEEIESLEDIRDLTKLFSIV
jgi:2-methylcitrate dehydratase PrpD